MAFADEVAALVAEVQLRYGTDHLRSLTNPNDPDNTGIDTTTTGKLYKAATSVAAEFQTRGQVLFDNTNVAHMDHACEGVEVILMLRMGQVGARAEVEAWRQEFEIIRRTGPRAHIGLDSNSGLTITDEGQNGETVRPWSEVQNFRGLTPDGPRRLGDEFYETDG